jgi:hypothetical protein
LRHLPVRIAERHLANLVALASTDRTIQGGLLT